MKFLKVVGGISALLILSISLSNIDTLSGKQPIKPSPMFSKVHKIAVNNLSGKPVIEKGVVESSPGILNPDPTIHPYVCFTQDPSHCTEDPWFCYTMAPNDCTIDPLYCMTEDPSYPECQLTENPFLCVTEDPYYPCTQDPFYCYTADPTDPECMLVTQDPLYCVTMDPNYVCTVDPAYCYTYYPSIWPECEPTQSGEGLFEFERNRLSIKNMPNPVKSFTVFEFNITVTSKVKLEVFDLNGRMVSKVFEKQLNPGDYSIRWDGKDRAGNTLPAGVYIYKLKTEGEELSKKLILVR